MFSVRTKFIALAFFLSCFSLLNARPVFAYMVVQDTATVTQTCVGSSCTFGQSLTIGTTGTLTSATFQIKKTAGDNKNWQLCIKPLGVNDPNCSTNVLVDGSDDVETVTWASPPSLSAGQHYWLEWNGGGVGATFDIYGTELNDYSGGIFGSSTNHGTTISPSATVLDAYFSLTINNGENFMVEFAGTPTSTCDFEAYKINSYIDPAVYNSVYNGKYIVGTNAGISGATMGGYVFQNVAYPLMIGYQTFGVPKTGTMTSGTIYYSKAFICDSASDSDCVLENNNPHLIAESSEYQYVVNSWEQCTSTFWYQGESIPTFTTNTSHNFFAQVADNCNNVDGIVASGICNSVAFLFMPDESILNKYAVLKDQIAAKPPFGYITVYTNTMNGFTSSTTATSTVDMSNLSQMSFFDTIRTALSWLVYLVFGLWVFHRLKDFSLHG